MEVRWGSNVEKIGACAFDGCLVTSIYSYATFPPVGTQGTQDSFSVVKSNCKLYVKPECLDLYKVDSYWGQFNILSMDGEALAVQGVKDEAEEDEVVKRYNINGQRIIVPQKGVNIIRTSDGKVKKVLVK